MQNAWGKFCGTWCTFWSTCERKFLYLARKYLNIIVFASNQFAIKFFKSRSKFQVKVKKYGSMWKNLSQAIHMCNTFKNSKVCQWSRSQGKNLWYHVKGLVTSNACVQYESPITSGKKVMAKVKVFFGHRCGNQGYDNSSLDICLGLLKSGSNFKARSLGQKLWPDLKGLVTRNTLEIWKLCLSKFWPSQYLLKFLGFF